MTQESSLRIILLVLDACLAALYLWGTISGAIEVFTYFRFWGLVSFIVSGLLTIWAAIGFYGTFKIIPRLVQSNILLFWVYFILQVVVAILSFVFFQFIAAIIACVFAMLAWPGIYVSTLYYGVLNSKDQKSHADEEQAPQRMDEAQPTEARTLPVAEQIKLDTDTSPT